MTKTTILVAGTGSIGQRHARLLAEREDVELWLCDSSRACLDEARKHASCTRAFDDYGEALEAGPEIVYVCTPHHLHCSMSVAAFEKDCHVFCEKPLAENVADGEAIVAAARAAGKILQVGYLMRLHPVMTQLQEMIDAGDLGTIVGGRALVGTYFTLMASRNRFLQQQQDALILDYTHQPDYLSLLFGQVTRVSAEAATLGDLPLMQRPNIIAMTLRYASGALVQLHLDYVQYPNRSILEIFGDRQSVCVEFDLGQMRIYGHGDEEHRIEQFQTDADKLMRLQDERFLASVHRGEPIVCTGTDGIAVLRTVEAALQAAQQLKSIDIKQG